MNRQELIADIVASAGAADPAQVTKIETVVNEIIMGIQLLWSFEILVSEMNPDNIADIKREALRRYRYG